MVGSRRGLTGARATGGRIDCRETQSRATRRACLEQGLKILAREVVLISHLDQLQRKIQFGGILEGDPEGLDVLEYWMSLSKSPGVFR